MKAAWDKLGGASGKLGAPLGDQTVTKDVVTQKFTGGQVFWDQTKNTFSAQPAFLASALSGVQVPGQKMPSGSASTPGGGVLGRQWWRWLVVGIPTLLLIAIAGLVAWRWRQRRGAGRGTQAAEPGGGEEAGHEAVTESVSQWSPESDSDLASSSLSDGYRVPLRPRTVRLPSQSVSDWMPPERADLVDEPPTDDIESPAEFSHLDEDLSEDFHEDLHEDFDEDFDEDPDAVDTAPTRIPTPSEVRSGRHAAADTEDDDAYAAAAASLAPGQLAIHLPMDDPYQVPDGYPVKANASFGLYYMPDSALYEDTLAEIWFASEEIAQVNGFNKAG
jgi:hypothetical protein